MASLVHDPGDIFAPSLSRTYHCRIHNPLDENNGRAISDESWIQISRRLGDVRELLMNSHVQKFMGVKDVACSRCDVGHLKQTLDRLTTKGERSDAQILAEGGCDTQNL
jgi:hypothetical protein